MVEFDLQLVLLRGLKHIVATERIKLSLQPKQSLQRGMHKSLGNLKFHTLFAQKKVDIPALKFAQGSLGVNKE